MRESTVEDYLDRRVREEGGETRKVQWLGRRNAPDRRVMLPRVGFPCWVELKAPGEEPRVGQKREHQRLRELGEIVHVIDSFEGVDALFTERNQ